MLSWRQLMELGEQAGVYILHFTAGNDRPGFFGGKNDHVPVQTKRDQKKVKNEKKKREGKIKLKKLNFRL